jgi:predicted permease
MRSVFHDVRFAMRGFVRAPAFSLTAVATVSVGMAAVAVVFALTNALLLRPLPVPDPERLVTVRVQEPQGFVAGAYAWSQYRLLADAGAGLAGVAAWSLNTYGVAAGDEPEALLATDVSGNYFELLGVQPALGRFFAAEEDGAPGAHPVAVVSYGYWQTRLGGGSDAIGRVIRINGHPFTVIGVAPQGFTGMIVALHSYIWVPLAMYPTLQPGSDIFTPGRQFFLNMFGRLPPGTTRQQAETMLTATLRSFGDDVWRSPGGTLIGGTGAVADLPPRSARLDRLTALPAEARGPVIGFVGLLMVAAALVLTIAGVNIASMLLARATTRSHEIGVRQSLGASRRRLIRQLLTESTLLFIAGGIGGVVLTFWLVNLIAGLQPPLPVPVSLDISVDGRVAGFAFVVALGTGLLFGLAPALHATSRGLFARMKAAASTPRSTRLRSGFVVAQLALSLLLLVSAGLLVRALQAGLATEPGMDATGVAILQVDVAPYVDDEAGGFAFYEQLRSRLRERPEISDVALSQVVNLTGSQYRMRLRPDGLDEVPAGGVDFNVVDHGYFRALRKPVLMGRDFAATDLAGAPRVAIVNEEFARRYWPGENALTRRIYDGTTAIDVVGVVPTARYQSLQEEPVPVVYLPHAQQYASSMVVYARGAGSVATLLDAMRAEVAAVDRRVPVTQAMHLGDAIQMTLFPQRFAATVIGGFGLAGLLLAAIGIYGLIAFAVGQRRREIGVRIALGARGSDVVRMIARQGLRLLLIGITLGLAAAWAASRALRSLLHGVSPTDPLTFVAVPLLLAIVALAAAYVPARAASRVDPMLVLRQD